MPSTLYMHCTLCQSLCECMYAVYVRGYLICTRVVYMFLFVSALLNFLFEALVFTKSLKAVSMWICYFAVSNKLIFLHCLSTIDDTCTC